MRNKLLLLCFFNSFYIFSRAQYYQQYFDGADTIPEYSINIVMDTASSNIWQIGEPEKILFDSASTQPNVLMTDLMQPYPKENTSVFSFAIPVWTDWGILAVIWSQKIDYEYEHDGGTIEFWNPEDSAWESVFNHPYVYNFYGYLPMYADTLLNGDVAFTGTDTTWRDVWLCFDYSFLTVLLDDSLHIRFISESDTSQTNQEGWMIDNFISFMTYFHTIKNPDQTDYLKIYPSLTDGNITIELQKIQEMHYIESIEVINAMGLVVKTFGAAPSKFTIQIGDLENGLYFLRVKTNIRTETLPVVLMKK